MNKTIYIKETFLGCHRWPDAASSEPSVDFLQNKHAHDFIVTVSCIVYNDDRDLEFYVLRKKLREIVESSFPRKDGFYQFEGLSCEGIAERIFSALIEEYDNKRNWRVAVWENNRQGAAVVHRQGIEEKKELPKDLSVESYNRLVEEAREIFEQRKSSYGNSIDEIDLHTIVGLMRMKLFRIYEQGADAKARDELLDTINYAVFALARLTI